MNNSEWLKWGGIWLMLWLSLGCAVSSPQGGSGEAAYTQSTTDINPMIESLHLNCKELEQIARDLRSISEGHIYGFDEQLNHIQKAYLYTTKAGQNACHQWNMLSIIDYIKIDMRRDYFTYRVGALKTALSENTYDLMFLDTYEIFIENADALTDIRKAQSLIRRNNDLFERLIRHLEPLANPTPPSTKAGSNYN